MSDRTVSDIDVEIAMLIENDVLDVAQSHRLRDLYRERTLMTTQKVDMNHAGFFSYLVRAMISKGRFSDSERQESAAAYDRKLSITRATMGQNIKIETFGE